MIGYVLLGYVLLCLFRLGLIRFDLVRLDFVRLGLLVMSCYLVLEAGEAKTEHLQQGVYACGLQLPAPARDGCLIYTLQHPHKAHEQVPGGLAVQMRLHHLLVLARV